MGYIRCGESEILRWTSLDGKTFLLQIHKGEHTNVDRNPEFMLTRDKFYLHFIIKIYIQSSLISQLDIAPLHPLPATCLAPTFFCDDGYYGWKLWIIHKLCKTRIIYDQVVKKF